MGHVSRFCPTRARTGQRRHGQAICARGFGRRNGSNSQRAVLAAYTTADADARVATLEADRD